MRFHVQTELPLSADEAYALAHRFDLWLPTVDPQVTAVEVPDTGYAVGGVLVERAKTPFGAFEAKLTITEASPPDHMAIEVDAPFLAGSTRLVCTPHGDHAIVRLELDVAPRGGYWLLWPLLRVGLPLAEQKRLDGLRAQVRSGRLTAPPPA